MTLLIHNEEVSRIQAVGPSVASSAPPKGSAQILMTNILISTRQVHMVSITGLFLIILGFLIVNSTAFIQSVFVFGAQNLPISPFESQRTPDFSIAAVGDLGCSPEVKKMVNVINNETMELILILGDLSYQRESADCWFDIVSPIDQRMKIVLGDQDYRANSVLRQYKSHFNLSQEYYSFDYENVHFVALATEIPYDFKSPQYNFVKNDLKAASRNPDIKWIIVYSYRPQYSSPTEHPGNRDLRDTFHPLFQKYSVDLVLQAHNHNYERTYPIKYNEISSSEPIVADSNSNTYENPAGQMYVTVGTGGAQLHGLDGKALYVSNQYMGHGFLEISLTHNGRNLTGTFYSNDDGSIEDSFTIIK
ncbi:MAG: purple acid phosphatase [Thermoproteota archaeon]|nr:purple acid phosphatase [Thermoproteota archaeon]